MIYLVVQYFTATGSGIANHLTVICLTCSSEICSIVYREGRVNLSIRMDIQIITTKMWSISCLCIDSVSKTSTCEFIPWMEPYNACSVWSVINPSISFVPGSSSCKSKYRFTILGSDDGECLCLIITFLMKIINIEVILWGSELQYSTFGIV